MQRVASNTGIIMVVGQKIALGRIRAPDRHCPRRLYRSKIRRPLRGLPAIVEPAPARAPPPDRAAGRGAGGDLYEVVTGNLGSTGLTLGADQLARLNQMSMPTLGFPAKQSLLAGR